MNLTEGQLFTIEALNRIEGFVWPKDANFACAFNIVNGRNFGVEFYIEKPTPSDAIEVFKGALSKGDPTKVILGQHPDWRNSLITRDQFDSVDGWVRNSDRKGPPRLDVDGILFDVKNGEKNWFCVDGSEINWDAYPHENGYIAKLWRYHKPQKQEVKPEPESNSSDQSSSQEGIESLISKHKAVKEIARLARIELERVEAAEHSLMLSIQAWAESYGFDIRVLDESDEVPEHESDPELVITDWRDLRVGDVIWWSGDDDSDAGEYPVFKIEDHKYSSSLPIAVKVDDDDYSWIDIDCEKWKFIRRPSK